MSSRNNRKVDLVLSTLATGIYRPWYWANYKEFGAQRVLRSEWASVVGRFTVREIREGLASWAEQFGVDNPPSPTAFSEFILPQHTPASREFFNAMRSLK